MDKLSRQILNFHERVSQKKSTLTRKIAIRSLLANRLRELNMSGSAHNPMCGLYIVGSTLNGFAHEKSDLDLCYMMAQCDIDQHSIGLPVLQQLKIAFRDLPEVAFQDIICAKTPILQMRFSAPFEDIIVDLNVNNPVAIRNSHLLCHYANHDQRVRPLVSVIKEWAKRQGLKDPSRSTFSSYCLVLMVIHYLQCGTRTPILPSLHRLQPHIFTSMSHPSPDYRGNCDVNDNLSTLGELLFGFFEYFAHFDYKGDSICVRTGHRTNRNFVLKNSQRNHIPVDQWRYFCIEEPFTWTNAAHSIFDEGVFEVIQTTIKNSFTQLSKTRNLHALFKMTPPIMPHIVPKSAPPIKKEFVLPYSPEAPVGEQKQKPKQNPKKKKIDCCFE